MKIIYIYSVYIKCIEIQDINIAYLTFPPAIFLVWVKKTIRKSHLDHKLKKTDNF